MCIRDRFDDGDEVQFVDLENPIEPRHRQHDATARRHRAAGIAGTCAAHDQWNAVLVAQPRDRGNLGRRARNENQIWRMSLPERVRGVRRQ